MLILITKSVKETPLVKEIVKFAIESFVGNMAKGRISKRR